MIPNDPLDSIFESASSDLRTQLEDTPVPNFEPRQRVAAPVAAIVLALLVAGIVGLTQFGTSTTDVNITNTPDGEQQGETAPAPDTEEPSETPSSDEERLPDTNANRDTSLLTIAPEDVEITLGTDATPPAADRVRPALGQSLNDPAYGSVVTRLTDAGGRFNRVENNQRQMINADNSLMLTHIDDGTSEIMGVTVIANGELVTELEIRDDAEALWHPDDAQLIRHLSGGNASNGSLQLLETNVSTGVTTVIADLGQRAAEFAPTATHLRMGFGAPSADGNTWAWMLRDDEETPVAVVSYDLATDTILGWTTRLDPTADGRNFDSVVTETLATGPGDMIGVGASPSGASVVVQYRQITTVWDSALGNYEPIPNQGDSADVALLASGGDAYVYIDFNSASEDAGFLVSVDLQTFERTRIFDLFDDANTSVEVSGAGHGAPGWVVVSTFSCKNAGAWSCDKVMVVELSGQQRIVSLAHTYNCVDTFLAQPRAIPTADFSAIYFNSDSGSCGEDPEVYEIQVPQALTDILPTAGE